jgi:hypothetical protein
MHSHHTSRISWIPQIIAAIILGQTLFFKFTGAAESVALFQKLNAEPWGRIGSGVIELLAVMLLLLPRTAVLGALLGAAVMLGAIASHLIVLGIASESDGGLLFGLALVVLICCALVAWLRRADLKHWVERLGARAAR